MSQLVLFPTEPAPKLLSASELEPGSGRILPGTACISLWQPWASLSAIGAKQVETRSWPLPARLLGKPLVIHAAKRFTREGREICAESLFRTALESAGLTAATLPLGAAVAVVRVLRCRPTSSPDGLEDTDWLEDLSEAEWHFGDYGPERFGWFMELLERIEPPIPCAGHQGIWTWGER